MNISELISDMIFQMFEEKNEIEFKRNLMAQNLGCVPSQINYVLSSRFTPERGFIVESRRGGDGFVRITRVEYNNENSLLAKVISEIGNETDEATARDYLVNLIYNRVISEHDASMMLAALSESALRVIPREYRDAARASILKMMLVHSRK